MKHEDQFTADGQHVGRIYVSTHPVDALVTLGYRFDPEIERSMRAYCDEVVTTTEATKQYETALKALGYACVKKLSGSFTMMFVRWCFRRKQRKKLRLPNATRALERQRWNHKRRQRGH